MTFNLLSDVVYPFGSKRFSRRLPAILACLDEYKPDILCVQEYTRTMRQSLKPLGKDYQVFGEYRHSFIRNEANLIFIHKNHFKVSNYQTLWLSKTPTKKGSKLLLSQFPRIVTIVTLQNEQGKQFNIANTHLDAGFESVRYEQLHILLSLLPKGPTILCGDMNTTLSGKTLSYLESTWIRPQALGSTLRGKFGSARYKQEAVDQILLRQLKLLDIKKIKKDYVGQEPSNHCPLFAHFSL